MQMTFPTFIHVRETTTVGNQIDLEDFFLFNCYMIPI